MALWIGCPVGTYTQVSVNWHGYLSVLNSVKTVRPDKVGFVENPYTLGRVYPAQMFHGSIGDADGRIWALLREADSDFSLDSIRYNDDEPFFSAAYLVLKAHAYYRTYVGKADERRYTEPLAILAQGNQHNDWIVAATEWIQRRYTKWQTK
jgi:hypothetical protein